MRTTPAGTRAVLDRHVVDLVWRLVGALGGRYSIELGIDLDGGKSEVERWFVASTLFGARISAAIAERTFRRFSESGLVRIAQARHVPWDHLVELLDEGGYARYDAKTATRLQDLSSVIDERYEGEVARIGERFETYATLREALDVLPGWGPVTIELFLRELRGVWKGATPPLDPRAASAARHLHLLPPRVDDALDRLALLAYTSSIDLRDLESALVRFALAHSGDMEACDDPDCAEAMLHTPFRTPHGRRGLA